MGESIRRHCLKIMQIKPSISFQNVTKRFPIQTERTAKELIPSLIKGQSWAKLHTVFSGISFDIKQGETVGIVGKNGAGKSTILKLIAGVTHPNSGKVVVEGAVAPLIELGAGFHHELSGYENIFLNGAILGLSKKQIESKVEKIIEFSDLSNFIHTPIKRYSTGMTMRLAFSVAIQTEAPILLIDEVLAVGDVEFQKKCLMVLKKIKKESKRIIVFVSHSEVDVRRFCERALLIQEGKLVLDSTPEKVFDKYNALSKN